MNDINISSSTSHKKFDNLTVTAFGTSYLFVRTGKDSKGNDRWFNIAKCEINTDGHVDDNDGLVPDAVPVHAEEVAYLVAEAEERQRRLARAEESLRDWIDFRRDWSGKANKKGKLSLQKKEVSK
jgi:hypothetical protein